MPVIQRLLPCIVAAAQGFLMPASKLPACLLIIVITSLTACCQTMWRAPLSESSAYATLSQAEFRDTLAGLARSHEQKMQLVFYLTLPWISVEPVVRPVFTNMGTVQSQLDKELHDWANEHRIDLSFRFSSDIAGQAQKLMEDQQGQVVTGDSRADLTRDALIQMYMDYQWQAAVLQTLMPKIRDPKLRLYVQHSLKVHQDGGAELRAMLQRFKIP
jgi:hypothetical protein